MWMPTVWAKCTHSSSHGVVSSRACNLNLTGESTNNAGMTFRCITTQIKARSKDSLLITSQCCAEIPAWHEVYWGSGLSGWAPAWKERLRTSSQGQSQELDQIKAVQENRQDAARLTNLKAHPHGPSLPEKSHPPRKGSTTSQHNVTRWGSNTKI